MLYSLPEAKHEAARRKAEAYRRAAPWLVPPAQAVAMASTAGTIPAYFRKPAGAGPFPAVVIIPGLEATKEEMRAWEEVFLPRGIAALAFDGPGQGERADTPLTLDGYAQAVAGLLDYLAGRPDVAAHRLGVMGVSLGGLLAARTAALEGHRLAAAAEIGGTFDTASRWERANRLSRRGHVAVTHAPDEEAARAVVAAWTMDPLADAVHIPFLIAHGGQDRIVPVDQAYRFKERIPHADWVLIEDGNHVCNNLPHVIRPLLADWLQDHLG